MSVEQEDDLQLLLRRAAAFPDYEADARWDIVRDLHRRTDRPTFDAVCALGRLDGIGERVLSLDILGQIGAPANRPFLNDTLPLVAGACDDNRPVVLVSAITALGHLTDTRGLPAVCRHAAHPAAEVRFAVAVALPSIAGDPPSSQREGWQQDEPRPSVLDNAIRACSRGGPNPLPCEPRNQGHRGWTGARPGPGRP